MTDNKKTVMFYYRKGCFKTDDQAKGAFELAYQQAMEDMSKSFEESMGLSEKEFDNWMRYGAIPMRNGVVPKTVVR